MTAAFGHEPFGGKPQILVTRLIIHAPNVNSGGGRSLLLALLKAVSGADYDVLAFLDSRLTLPKLDWVNSLNVRRVTPNVFSRFAAEVGLLSESKAEDVILCLGNLPPLLGARGRVVVFVQNRLLIDADSFDLKQFSTPQRFRLTIERWWLRWRGGRTIEFLVQTETMAYLMEKRLGILPRVVPFSEHIEQISGQVASTSRKWDFIYVASGESHKNHDGLIDAWRLLSVEKLYPTLAVTVDRVKYPDLFKKIDAVASQNGLCIQNLGEIPSSEIRDCYKQASALIYASYLESFGLPLIEAQQNGLPVIAPEKDYVRDILDPAQTFDPASPLSIARAVKRFLEIEIERPQVLTPEQFLDVVLK